jgi:hypothetical protein
MPASARARPPSPAPISSRRRGGAGRLPRTKASRSVATIAVRKAGGGGRIPRHPAASARTARRGCPCMARLDGPRGSFLDDARTSRPSAVGADPEGSSPETVDRPLRHAPQAAGRTRTSPASRPLGSTSRTARSFPNSSGPAAPIRVARMPSHEAHGSKRGSGQARAKPGRCLVEPSRGCGRSGSRNAQEGQSCSLDPGREPGRRPSWRPAEQGHGDPPAAPEPACDSGEAQRPLLDLELEHLPRRVDRQDRGRPDDAGAVEARAEDEVGRAPADGVDGDATDHPDPRPVRADEKALRVREPVLENVAPPLEDVLPHPAPLPRPYPGPNLRRRPRISPTGPRP